MVLKSSPRALASVASVAGASSGDPKDAGSTQGQGTYLGCGFSFPIWEHRNPVWEGMGGNQSMFLSLLPSLSLKAMKKVSLGEDKKIKNKI